MKDKRQLKILEIIRNNDVETQEDLCQKLINEGYKVTQATVSRDIRELKLTKMTLANGSQKYVSLDGGHNNLQDKYIRIFKDGVVRIDTAQNILVIKTVSGMAMAVAAALDAMDHKEIVGSIAGDDTIMCAVRTVEETHDLMLSLKKFLN